MPRGVWQRPSPETRFWRKVVKTEGCWQWTGAISKPDGYGRFGVAGKTVLAHRFSYELAYGLVPEGLQLDHTCRNRACVRPLHLESVTQQENIDRGEAGLRNAIKTHCSNGHEYSADNTYRYPDGRRACRICRKVWRMKSEVMS